MHGLCDTELMSSPVYKVTYIVISTSKVAVWDDDTKLVGKLNLTSSPGLQGRARQGRSGQGRAGHTPLGWPSEGLYGLHCLLKSKSESSCAE